MDATVNQQVDDALRAALGEPEARAAVTFLGTERVEVLRFADEDRPDDGPPRPLVRYATLGMSARPMTDPTAAVADPERGPRAELLLSLRPTPGHDLDGVLRALAVFAASPQVEGVVVAPDGSLDLGGPLWPGAPCTSVLVAEGGGLVPELPLPEPRSPVRFLPLLPMTPHEAAWKRARGAEALREHWLARGTDLRDPGRSGTVPG